MKNNLKETPKATLHRPLNGKRDYYFHSDEDFREDRDWGKVKAMESAKSRPVGR